MTEDTGSRKIDPKVLKQVVAQMHRRYPEFASSQPRVRIQVPPAGSESRTLSYLLTFSTAVNAQTAGGSRQMARYLRVVVDPHGKLIKVTTSK